jgi:hypothetical protein
LLSAKANDLIPKSLIYGWTLAILGQGTHYSELVCLSNMEIYQGGFKALVPRQLLNRPDTGDRVKNIVEYR